MPEKNNLPIGTGNSKNCMNEADETELRRQFLKRVTSITFGSMTLTLFPTLASIAEDSKTRNKPDVDTTGPDVQAVYGYLVDTERCVGTGKCLTACRMENDVPEGNYRTWVERYIHFKDGTVSVDLVPESGYAKSDLSKVDPENVEKAYFVPKTCNHCEDAPCNQVCPVHASFTSPEGFELIDYERCIGCAYCVQACPYGVRFINNETGTADKCTWCYHRVMRDEQPACVESCPVGARLFGRVDDPESEISKRIAEIPTHVLKEHLGTHPKTRYVGISEEVT
jgi:tetrathionate reductase subunit B